MHAITRFPLSYHESADSTLSQVLRFFASDGSNTDPDGQRPAAVLRRMVERGLDRLALPGSGATLARWQVLSAVAARDLSLLKLFEAHTDARAILQELGAPAPPSASLWGVWCAEPPDARLQLHADPKHGAQLLLSGRKAWCSGAASLSHALVSCWNEQGEPCLAAVQLDQPGVTVTAAGWHAVGMAGSASVDVHFDQVAAQQVGAASAYVNRPGFWHGGAGIAACWYGAAGALAARLHQSLYLQAGGADVHRLAQLGAIDVALSAAAALMRESAAAIDRDPGADAMALALRLRLAVEAAATQVLTLASRALGAGALCRDPHFAQMAADLPVFLRQSHAERDQAALGRLAAAAGAPPWIL